MLEQESMAVHQFLVLAMAENIITIIRPRLE
jgi:hypothetical protein